ncbi:hypothetical protein N7466_000155 [Penicillium verhagenii]|uniref:uncharacterized protein n=1 Tax=Penicillium verhagenii TaxID=1562060 RepID=UPI0025455EC0|nr:uncharacterized protein N7466_000155 [Penicillium verhagenii]KAJ5947140.1 hypothetical protein N7466_000155 [Penicillium verhagenii]
MSPISCPLEALPPEIRRHLLTMMEFNGLRALVHASPLYHEQNLLDRQWLLGQCVDKLLGSVNIEASLVCQSSTAGFAQTRTRESITPLLESYKHRQDLPSFSLIEDSLPLDDIIWILLFHTSIVVPLANQYSAWALDNLAKETEINEANSSLVGVSDSLSQSEETRIIRALYRLQLWCNLFGIGPHKEIDQPFRSGYSSIDLLTIHASHFEPWEIEEINCVYLFFETIYRQIFEQIRWDVDERNPKFDAIRKDGDPEGSFNIDSLEDGLLNGMVTQGLELLHTITSRVTDHAELVLIMQAKLCLHTGLLTGDDLEGMGAEEKRRRCAPSDQDLKERRREPLPFQGDRVDGAYPPFAWTFIWEGTYSNITGDWLCDFMGGNGLRYWGYVMWDKERLESMGAIEVLDRQIKDESWLEDGDPRTTMEYAVGF